MLLVLMTLLMSDCFRGFRKLGVPILGDHFMTLVVRWGHTVGGPLFLEPPYEAIVAAFPCSSCLGIPFSLATVG